MYVLTFFLTFCMYTPDGGQCLDQRVIIEQHSMESATACAREADEMNLSLLENEVIYINPGDKSFFMPGAVCEVTH